MESTRQLKISRLIQKELGDYFLREGKSLFMGAMITVTKVYVTKDLAITRIYLSLFATPDKQQLFEHIQTLNREIRHHLAERVRKQIRVIPELHFYMDDSLDYIDHIDELLNK